MKRRLPPLLSLLGLLALGACAAPRGGEMLDLTDPAVMARLRQELRTHPEINVQYIDLDVDHGTVTISGIVDSVDTRENLRKIARNVAGVQQVMINVLIRE